MSSNNSHSTGNAENQIADALYRAIRNITRYANIYDGVIVGIDNAETKFVVDVKVLSDGEPTFFDVPLAVLTNNQASVIGIPDLNSPCIIGFRDGNNGRPQIISVDKITKLLLNFSSFVINCDTVVFNGGQLGGMVKAKELKTQSEKDKAILDALLQIINGAPVMEPGNGAPSAFQAALQGVLAGKQTGTWTGLEDSKITH
jgi:hypothetical protein